LLYHLARTFQYSVLTLCRLCANSQLPAIPVCPYIAINVGSDPRTDRGRRDQSLNDPAFYLFI
ncbi:MAG: hypothetical protein OEW23_16865, partial [Candidatus Aminicenantes bacterium]|nr:hypothetical protein [Candidatus Aminicenantes bacterium]